MNSFAASVKFHRRISQFVFKEMATLEFDSREDIVSFGFPSHFGHHRALSKVPYATQYVLVSYLF